MVRANLSGAVIPPTEAEISQATASQIFSVVGVAGLGVECGRSSGQPDSSASRWWCCVPGLAGAEFSAGWPFRSGFRGVRLHVVRRRR